MEFNGKKLTAFGTIEAEWSGEVNALAAQLQEHKDDTDNPHETTPENIGAVPAASYEAAADYITEYGTDGDWTWEKWKSGKAVCWAVSDFGKVPCTTSWGGMYQSETLTKDFPSGLFVSVPYWNASYVNGNGGAWVVQQYSAEKQATAANTGGFYLTRATTFTTENVRLGFYAVGRWK